MSTSEASSVFSDNQILCGRFRIRRFIARGGMGEVYEAEDLSLGGKVALKTIPEELAADKTALGRFKREIKLARQVTHPNICRVYDLFTHHDPSSDESQLFLTMELLEGESLGNRLRRQQRLSTAEALPLAEQLVAGLETAHAAGVIHRDLKAENIFLVPSEDGPPRVVIMDFGLAKSFIRSDDETQSMTRGWVGTPAYVAPEQIRGQTGGVCSDIYSLGIVLYEMVTGKRPFEGPDPISTAVQRLVEEPSSPSAVVKDLDPRWERCIVHCLKRDPGERFQQVTEIVDALHGLQKPEKTHLPWLIGLMVLIILSAGLFWKQKENSATNRPSLAILGFRALDDTSGSPSWLGPALGEMLTTELSGPGRFRLIPRQDVTQARIELGFQSGESPSRETLLALRKMLGADYALRGSYLQLPGEKNSPLRLDLKLLNTRDSSVVASLSTQGDSGDLFTLVRQAGQSVFRKLGLSMNADEATVLQSFPGNDRALGLYSHGLDLLWSFKPLEARRVLEQAIELESDFPLAHAALARVWMNLGYGAKAVEEAKLAMEYSTKLPREEKLTVEALYRENSSQWQEAIRLYRALWTFFPDNPRYALSLAEAQLSSGEAGAADGTLEEIRKAGFVSNQAQVDLLDSRICQARSDIKGQEAMANRAAKTAKASGSRLLYGRARLQQANALWILTKSVEARKALAAATKVFQELGDQQGQVSVTIASAVFSRDGGDAATAEKFFKEAVDHARKIGDIQHEISANRLLGDLLLAKGDLEAAQACLTRAMALCHDRGDRQATTIVASRLALVQRKQGELEDARISYQTAYKELLALGSWAQAATAANSIAIVLRRQGRPSEAIDLLQESLGLKRRAGERRSMTVGLVNLGNISFDLGRLDQAEDSFRQALDLAREFGSSSHQAYALFGLGEVFREKNRLEKAREYHLQALKLRESSGKGAEVATSMMALALLEIDRKDLKAAQEAAERALDLLRKDSSSSLIPWAQLTRARVALARNDTASAAQDLAAAESRLGDGSDETLWVFLLLTKAILAEESDHLKIARSLLEDCQVRAQRSRQVSAEIEAGIRLGLVKRILGLQNAEDDLQKARTLAEQTGYQRLRGLSP